MGCFLVLVGSSFVMGGWPTPFVENRMGIHYKIGLFAVLDDIQLNPNYLKMGSGDASLFERNFGLLVGYCGVPLGHGWVNHPWGLRMGWTNAEKFVFVQILRMYNWILII